MLENANLLKEDKHSKTKFLFTYCLLSQPRKAQHVQLGFVNQLKKWKNSYAAEINLSQ